MLEEKQRNKHFQEKSSRAINANRKFNQFIDRKVNSIEQIATTL
jgi:hypothetical protein